MAHSLGCRCTAVSLRARSARCWNVRHLGVVPVGSIVALFRSRARRSHVCARRGVHCFGLTYVDAPTTRVARADSAACSGQGRHRAPRAIDARRAPSGDQPVVVEGDICLMARVTWRPSTCGIPRSVNTTEDASPAACEAAKASIPAWPAWAVTETSPPDRSILSTVSSTRGSLSSTRMRSRFGGIFSVRGESSAASGAPRRADRYPQRRRPWHYRR